jgi:putative addiction module component (TIGR02574 family)
MTKHAILNAVKQLSVEDRRELVEAIEESIEDESSDWQLNPEQEAELRRRIAHYKQNPQDVLTREQVDGYLDHELK